MKTSGISPGFLFDRLSCRCRSRQPLLQVGLTSQLPDRGKDYRTARRACSSRAMRFCTHKLLLIRSHASYALTLFSIPLHRRLSPAIVHAGDRGSASSRIALPRPSRVDELHMSAQSKYGTKELIRQHVFWSFFDSRESPVKACESGMRRHRQQDAHLPLHPSRLSSHKVG